MWRKLGRRRRKSRRVARTRGLRRTRRGWSIHIHTASTMRTRLQARRARRMRRERGRDAREACGPGCDYGADHSLRRRLRRAQGLLQPRRRRRRRRRRRERRIRKCPRRVRSLAASCRPAGAGGAAGTRRTWRRSGPSRRRRRRWRRTGAWTETERRLQARAPRRATQCRRHRPRGGAGSGAATRPTWPVQRRRCPPGASPTLSASLPPCAPASPQSAQHDSISDRRWVDDPSMMSRFGRQYQDPS